MAYVATNRLPRVRVRDAISVATRKQAYLDLLYLVAAFPVGLVYFVLFVAGIPTALGSSAALVGLQFMLLLLALNWRLGAFERELTMWWLDVDIRPMTTDADMPEGFWARVQARLRNPMTWKILGYLVAKFPFATFAFVWLLALIGITGRLLLAPLPYLLEGVLDGGLSHNALVGLSVSPLLCLLGVVVALLTLHSARGLAYVWGWFARLTLGMSDSSIRLAEARRIAAREHAKAERSEQSRRELIVNASHELRTPIASIRGHVESLLITAEDAPNGTPPPEELRRYLTIIAREAERLGALVDDLLALARAESGELRLDLRPVVAGEVVEEVYSALAPLAQRERQVTLVRSVPDGLPQVRTDPARLAQVLLNLVRNAITYTPVGGIVSLSVQPAGSMLAFVVADTGIGIPQEDFERIFDRFYRTDASRTRSSGGFGLGLSIVRDLVHAMGGTVTVESTVGEGSRFEVCMPVVVAAEPAPEK